MTHRIETARVAVLSVAGGGANAVVASSGAIGISQQLNQTHSFLYLDLPIWIFFIGTIFLALIGSLFSLYTDVMSNAKLTAPQMAANLALGFIVGIIGAFVILPAITTKFPIQVMLVTSLSLSFVGSLLIVNIGGFVRSPELRVAIKDVVTTALAAIKNLIIERVDLFIQLLFGGRKK